MEQFKIGKILKIVSNYMDKDMNNCLSDYNITRSQMGILIYIQVAECKNIEANQVDIEKEFNLKNPTVTGLINRLEEKGYIKRVRSDKDKRYNKLELTESGREILNKGKRKAQENEEKLLKILTDDEIKELKRILTKIVNNI
ncbi:MAG TPA: MarR family transcriptional regulator [[Clostridium] spiroforme]|uniref:HTH-type transcriptional regulator MgrA n=1 Tax=Thomasclavelia spiroformis TaxID=29348 RepID=A0A921G8W6_9FIRM|nr:MarR family transcriptional regulator [Thomasclavelia spiroformis]